MTTETPSPWTGPPDRILDTWLEEVCGGHAPPDLTDRILAAHAACDRDAAQDSDWVTVRPAEPMRGAQRDRHRPASKRSSANRNKWIAVAVACGALLAAATPWIWQRASDPPVAKQSGRTTTDDQQRSTANGKPGQVLHRPLKTPRQDTTDWTPPWERKPATTRHAPNSRPTLAQREPLSERQIRDTIEQRLQSSWQVAALAPSPPAEDSIWCRRVYLKLLGRIPNVDELHAFLNDRGENRRADLVNRLLTEPNYRAEWSEYWAALWANVLIGRQGGMGGSPANREGMLQFLREALLQNRPFDQIVADVMSATGNGHPGTATFNGAANFWLEHDSADATRATDWATRIFWAQPLGCVRCHDQINGPAQQQDFWSLNAVFRTARRSGKSIVIRQAAIQDVYYERPDGTLAMAEPRLPDNSTPAPELLMQPATLRKLVAEQFSHSPHVARALVNRLWAHFLGFGFTLPVDDMSASQRVSHPELLEFLAEQTEAHQYDLQALMRWIALSDAFARSSRVSKENESDAPQRGVPPRFTHYYTQPLAPEAVYQSLALVAGPRGKLKPQDLIAARRQQAGKWARRLDTDEGGEQTLFEPGVQQSWMLLSDPLMRRATSADARGFLQSVAQSKLPPAEQVEHLFLAALARKPTPKERKLALSLLAQHTSDPARALEDIWWALLNSSEFLSDH